jgi:hypothetical protein
MGVLRIRATMLKTFPSIGGFFPDSCNIATPYALSQCREERL